MDSFTRDQFSDEDDNVGIKISDLGRALLVWTAMQGARTVTVQEAAMAFNTPPENIREAIDDANWIFTVGDTIELDGE